MKRPREDQKASEVQEDKMDFKNLDKKAKCPLYDHIVRTSKGQFIGIVCEYAPVSVGFDLKRVTRVKDSQDLNDFFEIFCADCYESCPAYISHVNYNKK